MKINFKKRIYMTDVSINDVDSRVVVMGWAHKIRNKGKIIFLDLRDISGILQVIFEKDKIDDNYFKEAVKLHNEDIVYVEGIVKKRGENVNTNLKTGFIEVYAKKLIILSKADIIPFQIENDSKTKEELRLKYRYIDLKRKNLRNNLILRSNVCSIVRNFLKFEKFIEIETPILNRSTPEGARDYLVPSRVNPGKFYALPQSPQLFKQLLMCSGYDRYYQIARCFRDEDLRAERQPEFTQIDMELSFVDMDYIIDINERLLKKIFKEILDLDIKIPFKRITWEESMDKYGVDKPDLRYGMEIIDITDIAKNSKFSLFKNAETVRGIKIKNGFNLSNRQIKLISEFVHDFNAKFISYIKISDNYNIKSSFDKYTSKEELSLIIDRFRAEKNDLIFIIADTIEVVRNSLGNLRCKMSKDLDIINKNDYKFVWITEFPLFKYSKEKNRYVSNHHPFTKPVKEDIPKLDTDIINIKSQTYDIIVNGYELGGGSIRINDKDLQSKIFKILKIKDEDVKKSFGFLIDAFKYGVPPHGGLAYGLDRLVMLLAKTDNIRDVMAFPKNKDAKCLMSETPNSVESSQLNELKIKLIN